MRARRGLGPTHRGGHYCSRRWKNLYCRVLGAVPFVFHSSLDLVLEEAAEAAWLTGLLNSIQVSENEQIA